jgi:hypothetical protein
LRLLTGAFPRHAGAPKDRRTAISGRKAIVDDEALTREQHLRNLRVLKEKAEAAGNLVVVLNAEKLRGDVMRHYVKQIEQGDAGDFSKMNKEELDEFIASHMRQGEAFPSPWASANVRSTAI